MTRGKNICKQLKEVRHCIAEENDIPLEMKECTYEGPCRGTCPRCEAEVRYLEEALDRRKRLGKKVAVAGLCVSLAACGSCSSPNSDSSVNPNNWDETNRDYDDDVEGAMGMVQTPDLSLPFEYPVPDDPDEDRFFEEAYLHPGVDPMFPGGEEGLKAWVDRNLRYPPEAYDKKIQGRVSLALRINESGEVIYYRILHDIGGHCAQEVARLVRSMPQWEPGGIEGVGPVSTVYQLDVDFHLPKKRPEEWIEIEPVVVGPESENEIFTVVEIDPEFPGGIEAMLKFFQDNIRYPKEAKRKNISGKVYITFVVEKDGSISNPRILRDIGGGCGAEAIRVATMMPKWTPGQQRHRSVRVQFNLPVNFELPK